MSFTRSLSISVGALSLMVGCAQDVGTAESVGNSGQALQDDLGLVYTIDHFVQVSPDVTLHVVEKYTDDSLRRGNRRALLMLSGTLVDSVEFNLPAPYNGLDRAAQAGYFAYAVDYEGYGQSTFPSDGKIVTASRLLNEMGGVVEWIRHSRWVRRVDIMGSSLGSSLAVELGGINSPIDRHHVGKLVLTSVVYKNVTPAFQAAFFNPFFEALLRSIPGGYITTTADAYAPIVLFADPAAAAYVDAEVPGTYAVGPTLEGFHLPIYPAQDGRAPVRQYWGTFDPITPLSDVLQFQSEYGGRASYDVLEGSSHIPFYGPAKETFWQDVFGFLDQGGDCWDPGWKDGCGDDVQDGDSTQCGIESSAPMQPALQGTEQRCSAW